MRRLPPPVRARACRSARTRACACVRVPGYERHTRVCARANDLFLAGVVQPPDALFGATHGHATIRRLFLFSTSPASVRPSPLLSFSPPHHLFLRLLSPFPPRAFLSLVTNAYLRASRSPSRLRSLSLSPFLPRSFNFSSLLSRDWMKWSRKTARGRTNDRFKRGY